MRRIAETISGPSATRLDWHHSRQDIVDGVEKVFSAIKEREDRERELLESLWDAMKKIAGAAGVAGTPILIGTVAAFAPFAAIGAGYMAAAEEIKKKRSSIAFAEGVVLGVMAETSDNVRDYFWEANPAPNPAFPAGAKIAQYYYNGALVLGYAQGREIFDGNLSGPFWVDTKRGMTTEFGDPEGENWGRREWIDFYTTVAGAFYRLHISE